MTLKDSLIVLFIVGAMSLVANVIGTPYGVIESIPGLLILIAMAITGMAMAKFLPGNIPAVAYVVTLACLLSYPGVPGSEYVNAYVKKSWLFAVVHSYSGVCRCFYRQGLGCIRKKRLANCCYFLHSFYRYLYRISSYCTVYFKSVGTNLNGITFSPLCIFIARGILNLARG